jgi:hypothetical protein
MQRIDLRGAIVGSVLVVAGIIAGSALSTSNVAWGEVRGTPPTQAFKSGGQLSLPLLKEIATTLHQIEARLARLETAAQKMQTSRTNSQGKN